MESRRFAQLFAIGGAALALTSCSGRTEPATEVGPHSAKLNAYGKADNGPAYSFFKYQRSEYDQYNQGWESFTPRRDWPAGAAANFSETVSGLLAGTSYTYRVCGNDQGQAASCTASSQKFTTASTPTSDVVDGRYTTPYVGYQGNLHAVAGPTGASPSGTFSFAGGKSRFSGRVTCLTVSGSRATVGVVGTGNGGWTDYPQTGLVTVVDGGSSGDTTNVQLTEGTTPPSCAAASFANQSSVGGSSLVVQDAR